jgi:2-polyprenyl-6-methoxyphenol hydroxylase-like FAD-dependent oxidoreductase
MTEVVIIGAGLAGLSCALSLEAAHLSVTLLRQVTPRAAGCTLISSKVFASIADSR